MPGKTSLSISVGKFSIVFSGAFNGLETIPLLRIRPPLGPLKVLWVVVVIIWNPKSSGFGKALPAIRPAIWAISAIRTAPTSLPISTNFW